MNLRRKTNNLTKGEKLMYETVIGGVLVIAGMLIEKIFSYFLSE